MGIPAHVFRHRGHPAAAAAKPIRPIAWKFPKDRPGAVFSLTLHAIYPLLIPEA